MLCLSYYGLGFLFKKIRVKDKTRFCLEGGRGERGQGCGEKWPKQCMKMLINE
jgi:hypothetical protein